MALFGIVSSTPPYCGLANNINQDNIPEIASDTINYFIEKLRNTNYYLRDINL